MNKEKYINLDYRPDENTHLELESLNKAKENLSKFNLNQANLEKINLINAVMKNSNLSRANLKLPALLTFSENSI